MDQRHSWRGGTFSCGGGKLDSGRGQLSFQFQLLKRWRRNWSTSGRRTACSRDQLVKEEKNQFIMVVIMLHEGGQSGLLLLVVLLPPLHDQHTNILPIPTFLTASLISSPGVLIWIKTSGRLAAS
jgi:hypothetical protein